MKEHVNHPDHYNQGGIECIDAIEAALTPEQFIGFLKGQELKYVWRMGHKDSPVQELAKARWYNQRLSEFLGKQHENTSTQTLCEMFNMNPIEPEWEVCFFVLAPSHLGWADTFPDTNWNGKGWYVVKDKVIFEGPFLSYNLADAKWCERKQNIGGMGIPECNHTFDKSGHCTNCGEPVCSNLSTVNKT